MQGVLREAKRLHRAATSDSLSTALPVLRRLMAARAMPATSLPDLFRLRSHVQRKHLLRTLATEAGHDTWEAYRPSLNHAAEHSLDPFAILEHRYAHLNLWFSNEAQALAFAAEHGGQVVCVGTQAVVLPSVQSDSHDTQGV